MKQRHDYMLRCSEEDKRQYPMWSGMTQHEADYLKQEMTELYETVMEGLR